MRQRLPTADLLLLFTVLLWGFNFVAVRYAVTHGFKPVPFAAMRYGLGTVAFVAIAVRTQGTLRIARRDLPLVAGVFGVVMLANQIGFAGASRLTTASTVALVFGTLPVFVALIGWRARVERPHARHWAAAAISFAGVALVAAGAQSGLSSDLGGILLALLACVTWAFYSVVGGPYVQRYSPYRVGAIVGIAASIPLAAIAAPQFARADWGAVSPLAWAALAYAVLVTHVLTNVLWFGAIDRLGANHASLYANLQPFLGVMFAVVVLSETLSVLQIVGGCVIAAAIGLSGRRSPVEIVD